MRLLGPYSICPLLHPRAWAALGGALVLLAFGGPALAETDPPFDMEPSSWMSFDRYKEKPANWIAPAEKAQAALQPVVAPPPLTPSDMPVITLPTRPVATPALPGFNKDFDVNVSTTEDENWRPTATLANPEAKPDIELQEHWQDAAAVARMNKDKKQILETASGRPAYDVRLSYLPAQITPMPKPVTKKIEAAQAKISLPAPTPVVAEAAPPPPPKPKVSAADAAACAALEAYKKRQLAAIESDRQTLSALQNAISQLGLNKQLDFMVGASGSVGKQATDTPKADAQNPPAPVRN